MKCFYKNKTIHNSRLRCTLSGYCVNWYHFIMLHLVPHCLKIRFYYYLVMGRQTDQETTGIKRELVILRDPNRRGHTTLQGHMGKHQRFQDAEWVRRKCEQRPLLWFPRGRISSTWMNMMQYDFKNRIKLWFKKYELTKNWWNKK